LKSDRRSSWPTFPVILTVVAPPLNTLSTPEPSPTSLSERGILFGLAFVGGDCWGTRGRLWFYQRESFTDVDKAILTSNNYVTHSAMTQWRSPQGRDTDRVEHPSHTLRNYLWDDAEGTLGAYLRKC
jgi:hypothetical protein